MTGSEKKSAALFILTVWIIPMAAGSDIILYARIVGAVVVSCICTDCILSAVYVPG